MSAPTIELRPADALLPYARNSRSHPAGQIAELAASIDEFGMAGAILVRDGVIAKGHGTLAALQKLYAAGRRVYPAPGPKAEPPPEPFPAGMVPVIDCTGWSETQFRAFVIADNKLALNAGWDEEMLRVELQALQEFGFDVTLTGFADDELAALFAEPARQGLTDPDAVPPTKPPISRPGDAWVLGVHRVRCGDATVEADVAALMGGLFADACWTDPPYNVDYESAAGKIKNDKMKDEAFRQFLVDLFVSAYGVLKPGAPIYVAHADTEGLNFRGAFKAAGFKISGCLIWAKSSMVLGRSDYQWQHEPILYGWRPGAAHRWYGGRKHTTLQQLGGSTFVQNEDGSVTVNIGGESLVISGENLIATPVASTVLRVEKPARSAEHPTMKPVELISRMLRNSTREGDVVYDACGGSGSTLISCEMLGRQARVMELDPKFVDVIVRRWQEFTGQKATHEATGVAFDEVAAGETLAATA